MVAIQTAEGGGDTAQTLKLALDWTISQGVSPQWFWAHPVDLPLVHSQTIADLSTAALENPLAAWRPICNEIPGHPVLIPEVLLARVLDTCDAGASMSKAWKTATSKAMVTPMRLLPVDDPGVITDFDTPDQLNSVPEPKE